MKKYGLLALLALIPLTANAVDLITVYQEALLSDPVYQQAIWQRFSYQDNLPIARAGLLPQAGMSGGPSVTKFHQTSGQSFPASNSTTRGYSVTLTLAQTVFNYAQFKALAGASAVSKAADATLNAAAQDLLIRVSNAYFTVLKDEENVIYNTANKKALNKEYDQINQQYKVGLKTVTDVYTAKASYDLAYAASLAAENTLADDKENLRAITGNLYPTLARLSDNFPLISPHPQNIEQWVQTAENQNWAIKAAQFMGQAAMENVKQQFGGHVPTVALVGTYNVAYNNNITGITTTSSNPAPTSDGGLSGQMSSFIYPTRARTSNASVSLNVGVPLFQGGLVVAQTDQARQNYQVTMQKLEQTIRSTINTTRQSFLGIMTGIQQIKADKQAIKSTTSSLDGLQAGYRVGTQTLVDVLNQQQKVFQAQTQYATDRYEYVKTLLLLKQAAGTLSVDDLQAINAWLVDRTERK